MYTQSGRYQKFDFNLPKGAKVAKPSKEEAVFDFKYFKLSFSILCRDFGANVPIDFLKYYVGFEDNAFRLKPRSFTVNISIKEKIRSVFYPFKKNEYEWIDNFLNNIKANKYNKEENKY